MEKQIGIVLLPDEATDCFVRGLSWGTAHNQILFGLRDGGGALPPHPHISLLQLVIRADMLRDFTETLFMLVPSVLCEQDATEIRILGSGWCFLESPRTRPLLAMQSAALKASEGFRLGRVPISWTKHFTRAQVAAYRRWGYPNVRYAWDPHFTFGVIDGIPAEQRFRLRWPWHARALAVVALGHHGIAAEILAERPLRTS